MLKGLSQYENLGTPKIFFELFNKLAANKQLWKAHNLREYFYSRIIDGYAIFDGCLPFAFAIGVLTLGEGDIVVLSPELETTLSDENHFTFLFLEAIILAVREDAVFHEIFCSENISYDIVNKHIQLDVGAFQFRYANFRHLLVSFSFLRQHPDVGIRKLIINPQYRKLFDSNLLPEIKRRRIGIEQLEKMLAQKQIYGREAEQFVLKFERGRLAAHLGCDRIEIISDYDVAAGYDIVSYNDLESKKHDRFIEVKSFSGKLGFHWSRNEMEVARVKKQQYFLYLVDRGQIHADGYIPVMIQNPYAEILQNIGLWEKRVEEYFINQFPA
ncbi:MAG TPA: DUF3883 domain-containing protein [Verrucomicrobiae bacterium]|nr:DUF3883 domain-containing protein [Verrucomicrobiae bacterium]